MFAELHTTSAFTFLTGASQPAELVQQASALGYRALAITDECSLAGVVRAHCAAEAVGLPLIIGSQFRLTDLPGRLVLLVSNQSAYTDLCRRISRARQHPQKGHYHADLALFDDADDGLLALWSPGPATDEIADHQALAALAERFPTRLWIACALLHTGSDRRHYQRLLTLADAHELPMVASNDVHMHSPERQPLQDVLTALRHRTSVDALGDRRFANAERHLRPLVTLAQLYPPALLQESLHIAARCQFSLRQLQYRYPREIVPDGLTAQQHLSQQVQAGAIQRYPDGVPTAVQQQLQAELALIDELGYQAFFLTVHDLVRFARGRGILCQGRGSAANSAVCYCLGITEVDPARSQLLFERFLSRERDEPPDIDVDFEHQRREEVIQYIYRKYGRDRAALAATVISYRLRSAIRDVGRALGLDRQQLELLSRQLAWWDQPDTLSQRLREAGLGDSHRVRQFQLRVQELVGFPRHLSQHVGGFVISDAPLSTLVPVEQAAMPDRTLIQWDKDDLEAMKLLKVDVLALGMLSALRRMLALINEQDPRRRQPLTLADLPAEDPHTYAMLCNGDSVGVFQVESRAQMNMLPRLRPRTFYDLVVQVAIVRPGPIQGQMVHPYLQRRQAPQQVQYPDPAVEQILARTLGVPIFQEQVIKMAMVCAGFTAGDADALRRAMARWGKSGELLQFRHQLLEGMRARGYDAGFAERLFEQMKGFGAYGFPESHAASFALLVYQSAWLKRHHPAAFYAGLLNSRPMGFYSPSQLLQDAQRHGIEVRPVCVDHSDWDYSLEDAERLRFGLQPALRIGLRQVQGLAQDAAERVVAARQQGRFASVAELCQRAALPPKARRALVAANALQRLCGHRHQAHWAMQAVPPVSPLLPADSLRDSPVYLDAPSEFDSLRADYASLHLSLGRHPLALLRPLAPFSHYLTARQLRRQRHGALVRVAGLITTRQRPGTASGVLFLTLEDETGNTNVVVWRTLQERYRRALLGGVLIGITGTLEKSPEGVVHLVAGRITDHSSALAGLRPDSHDFH